MEVLFPFVEIDIHSIDAVKAIVAGKNAISAQTYTDPSVYLRFLDSRVWSHYSDIFDNQLVVSRALKPRLKIPEKQNGWVAYPWTLVADQYGSRCLVWLEEDGQRKRVRHIRVYSDLSDLERDNNKIIDAFRLRDMH